MPEEYVNDEDRALAASYFLTTQISRQIGTLVIKSA